MNVCSYLINALIGYKNRKYKFYFHQKNYDPAILIELESVTNCFPKQSIVMENICTYVYIFFKDL